MASYFSAPCSSFVAGVRISDAHPEKTARNCISQCGSLTPNVAFNFLLASTE